MTQNVTSKKVFIQTWADRTYHYGEILLELVNAINH